MQECELPLDLGFCPTSVLKLVTLVGGRSSDILLDNFIYSFTSSHLGTIDVFRDSQFSIPCSKYMP